MSWGVALMWGTVMSPSSSGAFAAAYFLIHSFVFGRIGFGNSRSRVTKKWPRLRGHSSLVIPVTVTLNDYPSVAIMIVPAAMQPAIMLVKLGT